MASSDLSSIKIAITKTNADLLCQRNLTLLSCTYTGRDRQRACGATAAPQNRNIGIQIQQEHLYGDTPACSRHMTAVSLGPQIKFELEIATLHRLSRAVFFGEHRHKKSPILGLYAGVAHDSSLPCGRYCCAAIRAAACHASIALLITSRVNLPLEGGCPHHV